MSRHLLFLAFLLGGINLTAQTQSHFEKEIRAFERLDSLEKPAQGQILLYGSSSMRLWSTYQTDLAGYRVLNRGFGDSEMSDAIFYFDRVVLPLAPSWILLYEGDNDLANSKKSPEEVCRDFRTFLDLVKQKLPGTKVAVITLRPSLAREQLMPQQRQVNACFKKICRKNKKRAYFIDLYDTLLTPAGKPNGAYLMEDNLHLNAKGYTVWTKAIRDFLKKQGV